MAASAPQPSWDLAHDNPSCQVLAVGDHAFQVKCRDKIVELKRAGKTLLCVSHAAHGVLDLCERGLWLQHGELIEDGPLPRVLESYEGVSARTGV